MLSLAADVLVIDIIFISLLATDMLKSAKTREIILQSDLWKDELMELKRGGEAGRDLHERAERANRSPRRANLGS